MLYEASKAAQDVYGVAVSREGDVYFSSPYTGEVFRLVPGGGALSVYLRKAKNVGPLAFAPNGTLYMAELIPSEGYQSVFRLTPQGFISETGIMKETLVFTAPTTIGGIAFNSRGELFFSDGPKGRLWKVVNGTPVLHVDRKGWSTMYGIVFDRFDNLYFCDWSSPGNVYYLDFRLELVYRVVDGNKVPLDGAVVFVSLPNGTGLFVEHEFDRPCFPEARLAWKLQPLSVLAERACRQVQLQGACKREEGFAVQRFQPQAYGEG